MNRELFRRDLRTSIDAQTELTFSKGTKILITGVTGLVGTALYEGLKYVSDRDGLSMRFYGLSRDPDKAAERFPEREITWLWGDVSDPAIELPECDFILHAASNAHPKAFSEDPVGTMLANIEGTRNLLEHLCRQGHGRLIFFSTGEIYGENPNIPNGFAETDFGRVDSMNPRACYPESKRAAETLCAAYACQYGVDAVTARLCYVFGPTITTSNSRADAQFLRKALAGEDIVLKSLGTQERSYCYVPDCVSAVITLMAKGVTGEAYNIAVRGETLTIRQYAETLAECAGTKIVFELPPEAERQGYSAVTRAVQDPSKLEALGWKACFTPKEGLRRTYEAMRS